jgi:hypothetical protein
VFLLLTKKIIILVTAVTVFLISCGFADLRPVEIRVSPHTSDTVLSGEYSPLSVTFNTKMVKKEAESLLAVTSDTAVVEGDFSWDGNTLMFVPVAGWKAGIRYTLSLSGMARSTDGREIRLERYVFFYAINKLPPPLVEMHSPADGESVRVNGLTMEVYFSQEMDRISVETALSIDSVGDKKFEWTDDNKMIRIIPERALSPWTLYRWTLKNSAKSVDGVPLAKAVSAVFCTDLDQELPEVGRVYPVLQSGGRWIPTGGSLEEDFGPGLGIAVEFSKPMGDTILRSLRFEPSLSGRTERASEKSIVFIPSRDPEPETVYTLTISGDTADTEGLKIGSNYRRVFTTDIPFLRILSIKATGENSSEWTGEGRSLAVQANETDGLVRFSIHFSLPFTEEAKQKTALAISITPFFPINLAPIALRSVTWHSSDDRLTMEWEKFTVGTSDEPHYYKFIIPGGMGGISSGNGMYLENEISLYMEAL